MPQPGVASLTGPLKFTGVQKAICHDSTTHHSYGYNLTRSKYGLTAT